MCSHEDTIDDVRNGCEVCLQCGQVTSSIYLYKPQDIFEILPCDNERQIRNEIMDVCSMLYDDSGFITNQVITNLHRYSKNQDMGNLLRINVQKHSDRCILAYTLWETLNQNNVPRSPHEIAYFFDIPVHDIMKVEKTLGVATTFCVPSTYVHRLCAEVELNFRLTLIVEKIVQSSLDHCMHRPETIIGGIILSIKNIVLKKKDVLKSEKKNVKFFLSEENEEDKMMSIVIHEINEKKFDTALTDSLKKLSAKSLAKQFHVSEASLYSFKSKLNQHCLNMMYMNIVMM